MSSIGRTQISIHIRQVLRWIAAVGFIFAGANHFHHPSIYRSIIPPGFPSPQMLVIISGIAEIVGGAGLLIRPLRRAAGAGLIVLLICVFPANIYMAITPLHIADMHIPQWALWARLPLQPLMMAWAWYVSLHRIVIPSEEERHPAAQTARPDGKH